VNEPSSNIAIFLSCLDISINICSFGDAALFAFYASGRIDILGMGMAIVVWRLVHDVLFLTHGCDMICN
jgi:hypothetical protein